MTEKDRTRRLDGAQVPRWRDAISDAYADIFTRPPWNAAHDKGYDVVRSAFADRLASDAKRPGFRVVAAAEGDQVAGFASGWVTPSPYPDSRAYPQVTASIGAAAVERLLVGAIEVDELAVRPQARGRGLARGLLAELIADAPDGRAWLLTWTGAPEAVAFYDRIGWRRVPALPGCENDIVTYLSPAHPMAA